MNNPKFSIIVPVYNAEATIGRTIDILKELDYEEYEVVLVNDGSTDQTQKIIQELIENDERFELRAWLSKKRRNKTLKRRISLILRCR